MTEAMKTETKREREGGGKRLRAAALAAAVFFALLSAALPARASVCLCTCAFPEASVTISIIKAEHNMTRQHFSSELRQHEEFLISEIFKARYRPALMLMVGQMSTVMMQQALLIGSFFDARQQNETLLLFQKKTAEAHKDYHPSVPMCEFGTNVRSLAAAERNADFDAFALNKRFLDRQLGTRYSSAAMGTDSDRGGNQTGDVAGRLGQFRKQFCDPKDMNKDPAVAATGFFFCTSGNTALEKGTVNLDMDFGRAVAMPRIINADFSDRNLNDPDHSAISALSANLYGHDVFEKEKWVLEKTENQDEYLELRAVLAKRNAAQASFNSIVALKSRGTGSGSHGGGGDEGNAADTSSYMKMILKGLGVAGDTWDQAAVNANPSVSEADSYYRYLTGRDEKTKELSYYAQMEFLAKKLYQRPEFYTNLYDKPANVERQGAAMQAIGLMLDRDIYDSYLRSEMLLSMILELKVDRIQERVNNNIILMERDK